MAQKGVQWYFQLLDRTSGPARRITKALDKVDRATERVTRSGRGVQRHLGRGLASSAGSARGLAASLRSVGLASNALDAARLKAQRLGMTLRRTSMTVRSGFSAIFSLPSLLITGGVGVGAGFLGGMALSAAAFKESTLIAFETLTRSKTKAQSLFEEAVQFASATPFSPNQVIGAYQQLLTARFKPVEIPIILKGVGDLAALNKFDPTVISSVIRSLSQIKNKGRLQAEEMIQLAEAGVSKPKVQEILANQLGVTVGQVQKLQEAGKINADLAIFAIMKSLKETVSGGKLGSLMDKLSRSLIGLWNTIKSRPKELLMDVDVSPVKGFLQNLRTITDKTNPVGRKFKRLLEDTFGAGLQAVFGPLRSLTNPAKFNRFLDDMIRKVDQFRRWWDRAWPIMKSIFMGFVAGIKDGVNILNDAFNLISPGFTWITDYVNKLRGVETAQGDVAGKAARLFGSLLVLGGAFRLVNFLTLGLIGSLGGGLFGAIRKLLGWVGSLARQFFVLRGGFLFFIGNLARGFLVAIGPIGWVIGGVLAIGSALVWAYHKFDWFKKFVDGTWASIKTAAAAAWGGIKTAAAAAWGGIKTAAVATWQSISKWGVAAWETVWGKAKGFWGWLERVPANIARGFQNAWNSVVNAAVTAWNWILKQINNALYWLRDAPGHIKSYFLGLWDDLKNHTRTAWGAIKSKASDVWTWLETLPGKIQNIFTGLWDSLGSHTQTIWSGIKTAAVNTWTWLETLPGNIKTAFTGLWSKLASHTTTMWSALYQILLEKWNWLEGIPGSIKTTFSNLWDGFVEDTRTAWASILGFLEPVINKFNAFVDAITSFRLPTWLGGSGGSTAPVISPIMQRQGGLPVTQAPSVRALEAPAVAALGMPSLEPLFRYSNSIGMQLAAGLTQGLYRSEAEVIRAFERMSGRTVTAVEGVYQIHSPSRVMQHIGKNVVLGLERGILGNRGRINAAMRTLTAATVLTVPAALSASAPQPQATVIHSSQPAPSKRSTGSPTINVHFTINDASDAHKTLALIRQHLPELLGEALEQWSVEDGVDF